MFARIRTFESRAEQATALVHTTLQQVLPQLKRYDGFNEALALVD